MYSFSVIHLTRPLINVFLLFSDIDECALDDNDCTKGSANCTNTVGSFNCTCQTKYIWNGIECEGLFSLPLPCSMGIAFHGVSLIKFLNHLEITVCLAVCLVVWAFILRMFVCPYVRHSAFPLKRWNRSLPSSRTSVTWCRNYGVRTRLSAKSPSSFARLALV